MIPGAWYDDVWRWIYKLKEFATKPFLTCTINRCYGPFEEDVYFSSNDGLIGFDIVNQNGERMIMLYARFCPLCGRKAKLN